MKGLLELHGVDAHYGEAQALADASLHVAEGELVSVIGANGAGKTTLIRAIAGMQKPTAGSVVFDSIDITGRTSADICEQGIGQVAEGRQIFPNMTIAENLDLGGSLKRSRARKKANLEKVFAFFPRLAERKRQYAGTLSGGEQQMLAIGRCLMAEPRLILFDEPSLGLSPLLTEEMFAMIRHLNKDGCTVLLVEQNVEESLRLCNRAYVLDNGRIIMQGSGRDLLDDDDIRRAYLGVLDGM